MSSNKVKWSSLINFQDFYKNIDVEEYNSDNDEEEIKFNINSIDFSLNNEKILNEINKLNDINQINING